MLDTHPNWREKNFLIADDFSIVHRMLRDMLKRLGAVVIDNAKNRDEAVALLSEKRYDVVLCDYHFSEGPNGQQILEEARHRDLVSPGCIWLMVSSEKAVETVMGAAEQSPDGYILKPLTESLLLARLNRAHDKKQAFAAIDQAYVNKDYLTAIKRCNERLATDRLHALDLLRLKASLLLKVGNIGEARRVFDQVLGIREVAWAKVGLARIHLLQNKPAAAKVLLRDIVQGNTSYLDAYDQLAHAHELLGETDATLSVLEKAVHLSPFSVTRQLKLGQAAYKLGDTERAEQAFRTSIEVGWNSILKSPEPYIELARICSETGRKDEGARWLSAAREAFQDQPITQQLAAAARELFGVAIPPNLEVLRQEPKPIAEPTFSAAKPTEDLASVPQATANNTTAKNDVSEQPAVDKVVSFEDERFAEPLPDQARLLCQRASSLIAYLQANGYNVVTAEEAASVLRRAEKLAPQHSYILQLRSMLASTT